MGDTDSESDVNSDGEGYTGLELPSLIRQLKSVLDQYPDDGQILKELIQNAEDAGAKDVKILFDGRNCNSDIDDTVRKKHHVRSFKGPALCVYNDALFTPRDWKGIKMLHSSIKEEDPLKVGRFGLGFKSVFHITDWPCILSGDRLLFINPHEKNLEKVCYTRKLVNLDKSEKEACLEAFDRNFTFSEDTLINGHFSGTVFRFPFRQIASKISDNRYTADKVTDLFNAFQAEASLTLLFLKSVESISLSQRERSQAKLEEIFSVKINTANLDNIHKSRQQFMSRINNLDSDLPVSPIESIIQLKVETTNFRSSATPTYRQWLVINYYAGEPVSELFQDLCQDKNLSYSPYVGAAVPLDTKEQCSGHVFCFMPLPLEVKSLTGLPIHVNGFFALSQNRRHLKWPTADQKQNHSHTDRAIQWNQCLLQEVIPEVYSRLVEELIKHCQTLNNPEILVQRLNQTLPCVSQVNENWCPIIKPLYSLVFQRPFLYTPTQGGRWVGISEAVLAVYDKEISTQIRETVTGIYQMYNRSIVELPDHVQHAIKSLSDCDLTMVSPEDLCKMLEEGNQYKMLTRDKKLNLLSYALTASSYSCLQGLELLPVADGSFLTFSYENDVYWCPGSHKLFPGLEYKLVADDLPQNLEAHFEEMIKQGLFLLQRMDTENFPSFLKECIEVNFQAENPLLKSSSDKVGLAWLNNVWRFITDGYDSLETIHQDTLLMPETENECDEVILHPLTDFFIVQHLHKMDPLPSQVGNALRKLGITVLPTIPDFVARNSSVLQHVVSDPSPSGVLDVLGKLSTAVHLGENIQEFNKLATNTEKLALINHLHKVDEIKQMARVTLIQLNIFCSTESPDKMDQNLQKLNCLAPKEVLPVKYPCPYLLCTTEESRNLALNLGAHSVTLEDIILRVLDVITKRQTHYNLQEIQTVFQYILNKHHKFLNNPKLVEMAAEVSFLPSAEEKQVKRAKDYFDMESGILSCLFAGEDRFPESRFCLPGLKEGLYKLGLKTEEDVSVEDICQTVRKIQDMYDTGDCQQALDKGRSVIKFLKQNGTHFDMHSLHEIAHLKWVPCLTSKPPSYPGNLARCSVHGDFLVSPAEILNFSKLSLVGSVMPVTEEEIPSSVADIFQWNRNPSASELTAHLQNVVNSYEESQHHLFMALLDAVYKHLKFVPIKECQGMADIKSVWTGWDGRFQYPHMVWTSKSSDDIDLKPYRYGLPDNLRNVEDLFKAIGCAKAQSAQMLLDVLKDIKQKHDTEKESKDEVCKDLRLVLQILHVLKSDKSVPKDQVLLPVHTSDESCLIMLPVDKCTVCNADWLKDQTSVDSDNDEDEDICYVHADVSEDTALQFGVPSLTDRVMGDTEEFDMNYHQNEPLTRRLKNLLSEYKDGFSVPKEIIQNADDAGATKVMFLYDERENLDARTCLINEGMESLQGPALWAYNNAQFTDRDFENITKLSGATKEEDTTKVGKFGLGFNSVYNLTDVPSFISGNTIVIFDPHQTYLGRPGMKANLKSVKNQKMVKKMKGQFKPFEGVFDCHLSGTNLSYSGTLFRFPLRTAIQAATSDISQISYSPSEMKTLLKRFAHGAGNLLLFTQSVKCVQLYHLPKTAENPADMNLLFDIKKSSDKLATPMDITSPTELKSSVLKYMSQKWKDHNHTQNTPDVCIQETAEISLNVLEAAKEFCGVGKSECRLFWFMVWTLGVEKAAKIARSGKLQGLLPLASAAVPFVKEKGETAIVPLSECPDGFYKEGNLFCFLPLPISIPFPLHINGTFAVTSNRQYLCQESQDDKVCPVEAEWNSGLKADAVVRAVIKLIEGLQDLGISDSESFYQLWPCSSQDWSLAANFYRTVVTEDSCVFFHDGKWTSFQNAVFLDPRLRFHTEVGTIAFTALKYFWNKTGDVLIDLPQNIVSCFSSYGHQHEFKSRMISEHQFFEKIFFPFIHNEYWTKEDRDNVVKYVLLQCDSRILELVRHTACIPVRPCGTLKTPKELVHPFGKTASLFSEEDECFPEQLRNEKRGFCRDQILQTLESLGMVKDDLQWERVPERVLTVQVLQQTDNIKALKRCINILKYLNDTLPFTDPIYRERRYEICPDDVKHSLEDLSFLPVLKKGSDWPFIWHAEKLENSILVSPKSLFFEDCANLCGCSELVLDEKSIPLHSCKGLLLWLGVRGRKQISVDTAVTQLLQISASGTTNIKMLNDVCQNIYKHFSTLCSQKEFDKDFQLQQTLREKLEKECIILHGETFIFPCQAAFSLSYELEPYLFKVDGFSDSAYKPFFEVIGVRKSFDNKDVLAALQKLTDKWNLKKLPDQDIHCMARMASLLVDMATNSDESGTNQEYSDLNMPDQNGFLFPVSQLCMNDCQWVTEDASMKFLHPIFSPQIAQHLGVKTKRQEDLKHHLSPFSCAFGQHEKLTNRLKRILSGYTCDSSVMKELLQNADDAGASELMFIKDFRSHPSEKVFDDCWKPLQGPALCVYNNSYFTERDFAGIQDLGMGSKGDDPMKTGQYGVGFNAVYHLTDVPSFLTVGPGTEETLCILDPNQQYVSCATSAAPGGMFINLPRLRSQYHDIFSCYLEDQVPLKTQGTLFRFPLRTEEMAKRSAISNKDVTSENIQHLLKEFKPEMFDSLLFLHNVKKISLASISEKGRLKLEYEVHASMSEKDTMNQQEYIEHLKTQAKMVKDASDMAVGLHDISPLKVQLRLKIQDSEKTKQEWLVVHWSGFSKEKDIPEELATAWNKGEIRILPRGGVAVSLDKCSYKLIEKKAFCILPLPISTGLPVHINGHFALDHEARRNLWHGSGDYRSSWNDHLVKSVIIPALLSAFEAMKGILFDSTDNNKVLTSKNIQSDIKLYNSLFPQVSAATDAFWKQLAVYFYKELVDKQPAVFPVLRLMKKQAKNSSKSKKPDKQITLLWAQATVNKGFPGYFNDLKSNYTSGNNSPNKMFHFFGSRGSKQHEEDLKLNERCETQAKKLSSVLKKIGMKVIEAPILIYHNFIEAGLKSSVQCVTPDVVMNFLKSSNSEDQADRCWLGKLPRQLCKTVLKDTDTIILLIEYCKKSSKFKSKLDALPLLVTNAEELKEFQAEQPIIVTNYVDVLYGSSNKLMHWEMVHLFTGLLEEDCKPVKRLDIATLNSLLDKTYDPVTFKTGFAIDWKDDQPQKTWIRRLWKCLHEELKYLENRNEITASTAAGHLKTFDDWCLIPAIQTVQSASCQNVYQKHSLYPVKMAHRVIHLRDWGSNRSLYESLKRLNVTTFDESSFFITEKSMCTDSAFLASSLVAQLNNPASILTALSSHVYNKEITITRCDSFTVLEYFCHSLDDLLGRENKKNVKSMLSRLPFFTTLAGSQICISECLSKVCVHSGFWSIPKEGIESWSSESQVDLLEHTNSLSKLFKFLNIQIVTPEELYAQFILPIFSSLPSAAKAIHLRHIKDVLLKNAGFFTIEQEILISKLKTLNFIEEKDGSLHRAEEYFSLREHVFVTMCPPSAFPPPPYNSKEWYDFLDFAGIKKNVTPALFEQFAWETSRLGANGITEEVSQKSAILLAHLWSRDNILEERILSKINHINFLVPYVVEKDDYRDGKLLTEIHPPFEKGEFLVSFANSVSNYNRYVLWTSSTIYQEEADPSHHFSNKKHREDAFRQLGISKIPQMEKVILHLQNVCSSLSQANLSKWVKTEHRLKPTLEKIMKQIYEYMQKVCITFDVKCRLQDFPVVYLYDTDIFAKAEQVVIELQHDESVKGYIYKAPNIFGAFFVLFENLGAAKRVTANHYAKVLECLKTKTKENPLDPNELETVRQAIKGLFRCLGPKNISVQCLYLPSRKKVLTNSVDLVLSDDPFTEERACSLGLNYFLGLKELDVPGVDHVWSFGQLPEQYRPKVLTSLVQEHTALACRGTVSQGYCSTEYMNLIKSEEFVGGLIQLVNHRRFKESQSRPLTENDALQIEKQIKDFEIIEVQGLKTELYYEGKVVNNSEKKRTTFVQSTREGTGETKAPVSFYFDALSCHGGETEHMLIELSHALNGLIDWQLGEEVSYLQQLLKCSNDPGKIPQLLDKFHIRTSNYRCTYIRTAFPPPGTIIPEEFHWMLDNSFDMFDFGEYVGLEIYDPIIDIDFHGGPEKETDLCEESKLDFSGDGTNGSTEGPVYIYAIVREIKERGELPMMAKYVIEVGEGRREEVPATKLYKFCREKENTSRELVLLNKISETPDAITDDLASVRKSIRKTLKEAWKLLDKKDRDRVKKRLYLQWHPDKNPGRKEFCTKVSQYIQYCVDRLERGLDIAEGEDQDWTDGPSRHSSYSWFFSHMNARSNRHRDYYSSQSEKRRYTSASSCHRSTRQNAYPHKEEAKRWLRQAKVDLRDAQKDLYNATFPAFNWICFKCQQAAEKAMKAVLYNTDATSADKLRQHNLRVIAGNLEDSHFIHLASQLQDIILDFNRMQYPDRLSFPQIPSDVYTRENGIKACQLADEIVSSASRKLR